MGTLHEKPGSVQGVGVLIREPIHSGQDWGFFTGKRMLASPPEGSWGLFSAVQDEGPVGRGACTCKGQEAGRAACCVVVGGDLAAGCAGRGGEDARWGLTR